MTEIINATDQPLAETAKIQPEADPPLAEATSAQPAAAQQLTEALPVFIPTLIPAAALPETFLDRNPKLNTIGASLGYLGISNFGFSATGTVSPAPNNFFGFNIDIGVAEFSFNANISFNEFVPFNKGGWYIGFGLGGGAYKMEDSMKGFFDINTATGLILFDWLNISATLQMELAQAFNIRFKPMVG